MIDQGPPSDLLLRLWFTSKPLDVRCDNEKQVFELTGTPIRLSNENQRALADGQRGAVVADPRSKIFADRFNRDWSRIREKYPVYGALESLYHTAAVAHLVDRHGDEVIHRSLAESFAIEDDHCDWVIHTPREVQSIATRHTVRKGNQRHQIVLASGGVSVSPRSSINPNLTTYASLSDQSQLAEEMPTSNDRWWWDLR